MDNLYTVSINQAMRWYGYALHKCEENSTIKLFFEFWAVHHNNIVWLVDISYQDEVLIIILFYHKHIAIGVYRGQIIRIDKRQGRQ